MTNHKQALIYTHHADAAHDALLAREALVYSFYWHCDFWRERADELVGLANDFSEVASRLEEKHGSVFPGVKP
jgi:hypothetical protein